MLNVHFDRHSVWLEIITYRKKVRNISAFSLVPGSVRSSVVAPRWLLLIVDEQELSHCLRHLLVESVADRLTPGNANS